MRSRPPTSQRTRSGHGGAARCAPPGRARPPNRGTSERNEPPRRTIPKRPSRRHEKVAHREAQPFDPPPGTWGAIPAAGSAETLVSPRQVAVAAIRQSVGMDAATVKAMLEQHFASSDPDLSHAMYHDDAFSSSRSRASASSFRTSANGEATRPPHAP